MLTLLTCVTLAAAPDAPVLDKPVTLMTRTELKAERRRLEEARPSIALPVTMQLVGTALALIGGAVVVHMASNPRELEWTLFTRGDTGFYWAAGAATVGLGLLVPGLWLWLQNRAEHRETTDRLEAIADRLSEPFECFEHHPEHGPPATAPPTSL